jgi:hypothetical protein
MVTNLNDSGAGSLRQAIASAVSGDTIIFAAGLTGAITLTSGELGISKNLTITGPGAKTLSVRRSLAAGTPFFRIFSVGAGQSVSISGLTIADGDLNTSSFTSRGGGIYTAGVLTLSNCVVSNNKVGSLGGGIAIEGTGKLDMTNCTVSGNRAETGGGGGIYNNSGLTTGPALIVRNSTISDNYGGNTGGGIASSSISAQVTNSTISGNTAARRGGGIFNDAYLDISYSTVTDNEARNDPSVTCGGGGIANSNPNPDGVKIGNTIVAGNRSLSGRGPDMLTADGLGNATGSITSLDYNLIGNTGGFTVIGTTSHNITNVDPRLAPLSDNGGATPTHAPLTGSFAIDRGNNAVAPATDQRGSARPFDGDANGSAVVDIGAFELRRHVVVNTNNSGAGSLRQALLDNEALGGGAISFNIPASDPNCNAARLCSISPLSALPTITRPVTIDGYTQPGALPNFSAAGSGAIIKIQLSGAQAIGGADGLTITGTGARVTGLAINRFNAGVRLDGATRCTVVGNFIGTDAAGQEALPNVNGVVLSGGANANDVGGFNRNDVNLISGNSDAGVRIEQAATKNNSVQGNYIGTGTSGLSPVLNPGAGAGVRFTDGASENFVDFNTIAFNQAEGVHVASGTKNYIFGNSIWHNLGRGIDLGGNNGGGDGPTPNDDADADAGANNLQNYPVINAASFDGVNTTVQGRLHTTPNTRAQIEFFASIDCDHSGYGEGQTYLGAQNVQTDASGNVDLNFIVSSEIDTFGKFLTATASVGNSTSEFSLCRQITSPASSLQFDAATYAVTEGQSAATITVTRTNGSAGPVTVNYSTGRYRFDPVNGGASCGAAGIDYINTTGTLSWAAGDAAPKTFTVPICNDHDVEGSEVLQLSLTDPSNPAALGAPNTALLIIHDNDQHGFLQFDAAAAAFGENVGTIGLAVLRAGANDGPAVSVSYSFGSDTANGGSTCAPGVDYIDTTGTLSWAAGDVSSKTFAITPCDDAATEPNETINLALSEPTNGARLGTPDAAVLTVIDADLNILVMNLNDSGMGSLRAAITAAALNGSATNTLSFAPGLVGEINLTTELPALSGRTNISGPGASLITVRRSAAEGTPEFGILRVARGANATVSNLTISDGNTSLFEPGGGVFNEGTLTLSSCRIINNRSKGSGGGISNADGAHLTLNDCLVANNTITNGGGGAGIASEGDSLPTTLTINRSQVMNNTAPLTITGGGLYITGTNASLTDSTIAGNEVSESSGGGGIFQFGGTLSLDRCTVSDNHANTGGGLFLGFDGPTTTTLINTTVSGNQAGDKGGGIYSSGSALRLRLRRSTVAANTARRGGGLYNESFNETNSAFASIIAGNTASVAAPDISGGLNSEDYNLIGTLSISTSIFGATAHTVSGVAPRLAPLAANGGPTLTHALLLDSPAIDAGSDTGAPATDQRGLLRVSDGDDDGTARSDIGAFELQRDALPPTYVVRGRVTQVDGGAPLARVTLSLSGDAAATTESDADGTYAFARLRPGNYVVTPSKLNYSFTPQSLPVALGTTNATGLDFAVVSTATPSGAGGAVLISEFRLQGPAPTTQTLSAGNTSGELDEFIELYNNTNAPLDLSGYSIDTSAGFTISLPIGAIIPARGHYLIANSDGYSLTAYTAPDLAYHGFDLPANVGLVLLDTSNQIVDGVGFTDTPAPYFEGTRLTPVSGSGEYSFVRRLATGLAQDTGNSGTDFVFVSTDDGAYGRTGVTGAEGPAVLGAPGPESTASPLQRNATVKPALIDPTVASTAPPNRIRSGTGANPITAAYGTLDIRRKFTNATGTPVTALRFRVVDITTRTGASAPPPAGTADLRLLSSTDTDAKGGTINIKGTMLDAPTQPNGGGVNSSATVTLPGGMLAPGASINVRFLLGVQQEGNFRFFVNVEGLTAQSVSSPESNLKTRGTKAVGRGK